MLITENGTIKIGDFGISKILHTTSEEAKTMIGTPYYLSPELVQNKPYSYASDIWSLGVIMYELCALNYPFHCQNLIGLAKLITESVPETLDNYSLSLNELINGML